RDAGRRYSGGKFRDVRLGADVVPAGRQPEQTILASVVGLDALHDRQRLAAVPINRTQRLHLRIAHRLAISIVNAPGNRTCWGHGKLDAGHLLTGCQLERNAFTGWGALTVLCRHIAAAPRGDQAITSRRHVVEDELSVGTGGRAVEMDLLR